MERFDDVAYCKVCDGIFPLNTGDVCQPCLFEADGRCRGCGSGNLAAGQNTCKSCQEFKARKEEVGFLAALEGLGLDFSIGLGPRTKQ